MLECLKNLINDEHFNQLADAALGKIKYSASEVRLQEKLSQLYGTFIAMPDVRRLKESYDNCKNCHGLDACDSAGLVLCAENIDDQIHLFYKPCEQRRKRINEERFYKACEAAGLPDIYNALTPTNLQANALSTIQGGGDKAWYYIHGGLATGKTCVAVKAAQHFIKQGLSVKFWNTAELLSHLNPQNVLLTLDDVTHPDLLILDDFGAQYKSDWSNDRLFMVVDSRYRKQGITIFTSNYCLPEDSSNLELNLQRINDRIRRRAAILNLDFD